MWRCLLLSRLPVAPPKHSCPLWKGKPTDPRLRQYTSLVRGRVLGTTCVSVEGWYRRWLWRVTGSRTPKIPCPSTSLTQLLSTRLMGPQTWTGMTVFPGPYPVGVNQRPSPCRNHRRRTGSLPPVSLWSGPVKTHPSHWHRNRCIGGIIISYLRWRRICSFGVKGNDYWFLGRTLETAVHETPTFLDNHRKPKRFC